uniref:Uncharacterized protein n=1 Tax=Arundo donax TaxID=35708 RepID=A0A0A9EU03_ARUDO
MYLPLTRLVSSEHEVVLFMVFLCRGDLNSSFLRFLDKRT